MTTSRMALAIAALAVLAVLAGLGGCAGATRRPDLGALYDAAAQGIGGDRNPVIVIPGILGSKLEDEATMVSVWGAFTSTSADAGTPRGAALVALPMREGEPLSALRDGVVATDVLDTLTVDVAILRGLEIGAYVDILKTLAAGKYRDQTLGEAGAIDYGEGHYTCFQLAYDWRRDVAEQAALLHERVLWALEHQPDGGAQKVDVVAHSMGGLVLRYYLRYGPDPLPEDGSLPELDWEGARHVETAILVGTPSAGSALAVRQLVEGVTFASLITPTYRPPVLGSMPAIYQLMPRARHARVIDRDTGAPLDLYDVATWERLGWGLADPDDRVLSWLLPELPDADARRRVALDHLRKCLARAAQLHRALDVPAAPPPGTTLHLVAGDARATPDRLEVDPASGRLRVAGTAPGDNTVTRGSALMDERTGSEYRPRLRSPIELESVHFLTSDHLGLTRDPLFANVVLYLLLERPRDGVESR